MLNLIFEREIIMLLGSIEAGGTKFVCSIGNEEFNITEEITIPTTTPEETFNQAIEFFKKHDISALSISTFGPIEQNKQNKLYGYILDTPKNKWKYVDFVSPFLKTLEIPVSFNTDVNGSAYGEYITYKSHKQSIDSLVYLTVGTGVGGGCVINGNIMKNFSHSEMGHMLIKKHEEDLNFSGICPFHNDCLEGLTSGPSIEKRLNIKGEYVSNTHSIWNIIAYYIAQSLYNITLILRPDKLVIGGGVSNESLLEKTRIYFQKICNDYIQYPDLKDYISVPINKNNSSATIGNFALAYELIHN